MVARSVLKARTEAAIQQIEENLQELGGDQPEVAGAARKIREVQRIARLDDEHKSMFQLEAIAELTQKIIDTRESGTADPLEAKTKPQLRQIAREEGVEGRVSQMNKAQLIEEINNKRSENEASEAEAEADSEEEEEDSSEAEAEEEDNA